MQRTQFRKTWFLPLNFVRVSWNEQTGPELQSCVARAEMVVHMGFPAAVHGVAKSRTRLSDFTFTFTFHFHAQGSLVDCPLWGFTELDMTEAT